MFITSQSIFGWVWSASSWRPGNSKLPYYTQHPVILHGKHPLTRLLVRSEHLRLLHAGPSLLTSSICRQFYIIGCRKIILSITRSCVICWRKSSKPQPQMMGQLPMECVTPDAVFDKVDVDYARPVYIKQGSVRKPTIIKAVHLELVSDLTSEAFIAHLRRFIARHSKLPWSGAIMAPILLVLYVYSRVVWISSPTEDKGSCLPLLHMAKHWMDIHSWTSTSLWWSMGGCCQKHEDISISHCGQC